MSDIRISKEVLSDRKYYLDVKSSDGIKSFFINPHNEEEMLVIYKNIFYFNGEEVNDIINRGWGYDYILKNAVFPRQRVILDDEFIGFSMKRIAKYFNLFHVAYSNMDFEDKMYYLLKADEVVQTMHRNNPSITSGDLNLSNILVDRKTNQTYIVDIEECAYDNFPGSLKIAMTTSNFLRSITYEKKPGLDNLNMHLNLLTMYYGDDEFCIYDDDRYERLINKTKFPSAVKDTLIRMRSNPLNTPSVTKTIKQII